MSRNRLLWPLSSALVSILLLAEGLGTAVLARQFYDAKAESDREVLKINAQCNAAELRGDVRAMENCETDDFTHTHANGTVEHKAEYLTGIASGAHKFLVLDLSDVHVRSYGAAAIVEGRLHLRANNNGKIADVENLFMTVWVKRQGKWHG